MKQLIFSLFITLTIIVGCKKDNHGSEKSDETFQIFIERFSKDSLFQISRVDFSLSIIELNDSYDTVHKQINIDTYEKIDLRYNDSLKTRQYDKYTQELKVKGNKATIEIRGIDNGIMTDVYFEKRSGKWFLISWNDSST